MGIILNFGLNIFQPVKHAAKAPGSTFAESAL